MKFMILKNNKGFTLIELLVVISIIALLSSVVLSSLNSARAKSRNAKRLQDLVQLRTALELYAQDHGGSYPVNAWASDHSFWDAGTWLGTTPGCSGYVTTGAGANIPMDGLVPQYIAKIPDDPKPTVGSGYCYIYYSDGIDYKFRIMQTAEFNTQTPPHPLREPTGSAPSTLIYSLAIYSPGAQAW